MLLEIKEFIVKEKIVNVKQLTRAFQIDENAIEPMLTFLVNKGVIKPCQESNCVKTCGGCNIKPPSYYALC